MKDTAYSQWMQGQMLTCEKLLFSGQPCSCCLCLQPCANPLFAFLPVSYHNEVFISSIFFQIKAADSEVRVKVHVVVEFPIFARWWDSPFNICLYCIDIAYYLDDISEWMLRYHIKLTLLLFSIHCNGSLLLCGCTSSKTESLAYGAVDGTALS